MANFSYIVQKPHQKAVISNKLDTSRNVLITVGGDQKIKLARLNDLQQISSLNIQTQIKFSIIIPEKNKIITATNNSKIMIFDLLPLALKYNFQLPISEPEKLWIDPQFKFLIIVDKNGTILSLDIETKTVLLKINIPWLNSNLIEFDADGRNIFAFSKKNKLFKVRIGTGEIIKEYSLGIPNITKFSIDEEANMMIILSHTDLVKIDLKNNKVLTAKNLENIYTTFVWDEHHGLIILGGEDGRVSILKTEDFEEIEIHQCCVGNIISLDLAPNGLIYSAGTNLGEIGIFPIHQGINLQEEINRFDSLGSLNEHIFEEHEETSGEPLEIIEEIANQEDMVSKIDQFESNGKGFDENMKNSEDIEYCKFCAAELGKTGDFCPNCGARR